MLPTRAYADPLPPFSAGTRAQPSPQDVRPAFVVAVAAVDVDRFPESSLTRLAARTTAEAVRLIERWRPRVVAIDWDLPEAFDGPAISSAARQTGFTAILVTTAVPERAPAALKAGCHAVLLKPFAPNLIAARVGRLCREVPTVPAAVRAAALLQQCGTNRTWPDLECPTCDHAGAVGFEFSSHRRTWYACLACDSVWLGMRRE
jgi:CheY-like chemotaxis protein